MAQLKPGDRVDCRVKEATIVSPYKDFDEVITFEIVAVDKYGCYLFVPVYLNIKNTFILDKYKCKSLSVDSRFLGENAIYIRESMIFQINSILDGFRCIRCLEFFPMASPNQDDGTLICWSCRHYPSYR